MGLKEFSIDLIVGSSYHHYRFEKIIRKIINFFCEFDFFFLHTQYSTIPPFHHSMCMACQYSDNKNHLISKSFTISETLFNRSEREDRHE